MTQKGNAEALLSAIERLGRVDSSWGQPLLDLAQDIRKLDQAELKLKIEPLAAKVREAISGLKMERCDQLTVDEVAAYMGASQQTAERQLKIYLGQVKEGKKPGQGGYHLHNKALGRYSRYFYHLSPLQDFLDAQEEDGHHRRSAHAQAQWQTSRGLARRQGRQRNETKRRDDIFQDAVALANQKLKDHPDLIRALEALRASHHVLKEAGIDIELQLMPSFAAFVQAQTRDITTAVDVPQPWLTDHEGRILGHAWWPIGQNVRQIRAALTKGGTIVSLTLVAALRQDWKPGAAWFVWTAVSELAARRWLGEHPRQLATMRWTEAEKRGEGLRSKERSHA